MKKIMFSILIILSIFLVSCRKEDYKILKTNKYDDTGQTYIVELIEDYKSLESFSLKEDYNYNEKWFENNSLFIIGFKGDARYDDIKIDSIEKDHDNRYLITYSYFFDENNNNDDAFYVIGIEFSKTYIKDMFISVNSNHRYTFGTIN